MFYNIFIVDAQNTSSSYVPAAFSSASSPSGMVIFQNLMK